MNTSKEVSVWLAENIRLSAFTASDAVDLGVTWWNDVTKQQPDTRSVKNKARLQENGSIRNNLCDLSLDYQPGRIDWNLTPLLEAGQPVTELPSFARFADALALASELFSPWLDHCPILKRLAFGAVINMPVKDRVEGYQTISRFLPAIKLDCENSSDFTYTINRPRLTTTGIRGLNLNRVTRWAVIRGGIGWKTNAPDGTPAALPPATEFHACRVEIDINTAVEYPNLLQITDLKLLFPELLKLAEEIALNGDIS